MGYSIHTAYEIEMQEKKDQERINKYKEFMKLCNEKYKDIFSSLEFSERQERTEYVLKYLFHRSKLVGSKTFVCTKKDMLEYYHSVISDKSLRRNLRTLEKNGYIECINASDENGATCGIKCRIKI